MLEVKNLTKYFNDKLSVDHIDLSIQEGQLVALLGHNGAGKSTTINMLTGLLKPDEGDIYINGYQPSDAKYSHYIGVVFQDSVLDKQLTVAKNLSLAASMYQDYDDNFCKEMMQKFEIDSIKNQKYSSLSGGQRRRVDIVRSLLSKPQLLFLDEPSTGLDIQTRNKIWSVLSELRRKYGLTIVLTTHYLEEVNQADWVYVMDNGKIIAADTVNNLKNQYAPNKLILRFKNDVLARKVEENDNVKRQGNEVVIKISSYQKVIEILNQNQDDLFDFEYVHGTMNDTFIELTGKDIK